MSQPWEIVPARATSLTLLTDDDLQRAQPYNRVFQELGGAVEECRRRMTYRNLSGTLAQMIARPEWLPGDRFSVYGLGVYVPIAAADPWLNAPLQYRAESLGNVYWTLENWELYATYQVPYVGPTGPFDDTPVGKLRHDLQTNRVVQVGVMAGSARLDSVTPAGANVTFIDHPGVCAGVRVGDRIAGSTSAIRLVNAATAPGAYGRLRVDAVDGYGTPSEFRTAIGEALVEPTETLHAVIAFDHTAVRAGETRLLLRGYASASGAVEVRGLDVIRFVVGNFTVVRP